MLSRASSKNDPGHVAEWGEMEKTSALKQQQQQPQQLPSLSKTQDDVFIVGEVVGGKALGNDSEDHFGDNASQLSVDPVYQRVS